MGEANEEFKSLSGSVASILARRLGDHAEGGTQHFQIVREYLARKQFAGNPGDSDRKLLRLLLRQ